MTNRSDQADTGVNNIVIVFGATISLGAMVFPDTLNFCGWRRVVTGRIVLMIAPGIS